MFAPGTTLSPDMTTLCLHALELSSPAAYNLGVTGRLGRVFVALIAFLALQGSIQGSDLACAAFGHHSVTMAGPEERSSMPGMPMHAVNSGAAEDASQAVANAAAISGVEASPGADAEGPCEHGRMPTDCAAMGACTVFTQAALRLQEWTADPHAGVFAVTTGPASAIRSPELPPPRWS